jgi:opacity protein-like surface antigen
MNKILSIAAIVALVTTLSFAQEGGPKFGIRAGFSLYDPTGKDAKEFDMSFGSGGGIVASIPITDFLSFNPELNFFYRRLLSMSESEGGYKMEAYESEFALSIPAMLQVTPIGGVGFYLAAGVQLDVPFSPEFTMKVSGPGVDEEESEKIDDRSTIDFGIALGLGYNITPNFGIDLRCVIGMTNAIDESGTDFSFNQYGIGVTYFF